MPPRVGAPGGFWDGKGKKGFDSPPSRTMDKFVEKAFEDALNEMEKMDKVKQLFDDNQETLFPIFIKYVGIERSEEFRKAVLETHGEELVLLLYIFFTAGYVLREF